MPDDTNVNNLDFEYRGFVVKIDRQQTSSYNEFYANGVEKASGRVVVYSSCSKLPTLEQDMRNRIDAYLDMPVNNWKDLVDAVLSYAADDGAINIDEAEVAALVKRLYKTSPQLFT